MDNVTKEEAQILELVNASAQLWTDEEESIRLLDEEESIRLLKEARNVAFKRNREMDKKLGSQE